MLRVIQMCCLVAVVVVDVLVVVDVVSVVVVGVVVVSLDSSPSELCVRAIKCDSHLICVVRAFPFRSKSSFK